MSKKNKKDKKTKPKLKKLTLSDFDTPLHQAELCTDQTTYYHLLTEERELLRQLNSFVLAGDSINELFDTQEYKLIHTSLLKKYQRVNKQYITRSKRFSTASMTQLIDVSSQTFDIESALLAAFAGTSQSLQLTKEEYNLATFCFEIGQAQIQQKMTNTLLHNDKMGNNMKLLSQIKEFISNPDKHNNPNDPDNNNSNRASLNLYLTKKKQKAKRDKQTEAANPSEHKTEPLEIN